MRYNFFTYRQKHGESFDEFTTTLRKLAQDCEFGTLKDSLLKDMITIGTDDIALQEHLLREPDIDLDKSIKLGKAAEVTRQQAKILQAHVEEKPTSAITKTLKDKPPSNYSKDQGTSKIIQCKFCSYTQQGEMFFLFSIQI